MIQRIFILLIWLVWVFSVSNAEVQAETLDKGSECRSCHREQNSALVMAWEKSRHNTANLDCRTCHGVEHDGQMAARSRQNTACMDCHPKESKSYTVSKHGVIAILEAGRMNDSLPLREANFRVPTCAYCHLHNGNHDVGAGVLPNGIAEIRTDEASRKEIRATPCRDCHSPRLVETWFATGDRMVEIGRMKVREAMPIVARIALLDVKAAAQAQGIYQRMVADHLYAVRLGVGHQSPDDQWWHGQPALDGDLLRIKSILGEWLSLEELVQ